MNLISKDAIDWAIARLSEQGITPYSPCEVDGRSNVRLCAAAAIAAGGVQTTEGSDARRKFEEVLGKTRDSELIRSVFKRLGWNIADCERVLSYNNSLSENQRQQGVVALLRNWVAN